MMTKEEKLFLKESNAIENIWDEDSLKQAIYAWEFLKKEKKLMTGNILKTHKVLMLHQKLRPNERGYFRTVPVWIGGRQGKPWYVIPDLMAQWVENANKVLLKDDVTAEPRIKQHHIEFETIHPFVDGNGRIGRLIMLWQRMKVELPIKVIYEKEKQEYYKWFG